MQPFTVWTISSDLENWLVSEYATVTCYYWKYWKQKYKNCLILSVYIKSVKRAIFNYKFTECVYKDYLVKDRVSKLLKMSLSVILPIWLSAKYSDSEGC